ncbi:hypothetical protein CN268_26455 [Bacillus anthracis]|nr:hypothetical protein CON09_13635 [Bacillus anthracis]PES26314.1 hypothetical protein CN488_00290 [Bacillus anthracis]PEY23876.1 hypothetical protein CN340_19025 [Bacillus anthracis]PFB56937.1 hypothetical protein CN268_26455 [Bacillus anthracis]PGR24094.1 hypothetical protein COC50_12285 [Bacillus anthracis]
MQLLYFLILKVRNETKKQGEMRNEKSDGSYGSSGRGFRKWQTSCNGVKQIMKRTRFILDPLLI